MHEFKTTSLSGPILNLRNRTGEERRRQSLCENVTVIVFVKNLPPNFTFIQTDLSVKDQKTLMLSEDYDKSHR